QPGRKENCCHGRRPAFKINYWIIIGAEFCEWDFFLKKKAPLALSQRKLALDLFICIEAAFFPVLRFISGMILNRV
ncbi:MAG: hypothetical protein IJE17_05530, partial [Clostridia bacterium]|nr:hypothetical protein [Clostridia bacterium]